MNIATAGNGEPWEWWTLGITSLVDQELTSFFISILSQHPDLAQK